MFKKIMIPATLALALVSGLAPAFAVTAPSPAGQTGTAAVALNSQQVAQLAVEAGITPQQASNLSISELARLKELRDGNDGHYVWTKLPQQS